MFKKSRNGFDSLPKMGRVRVGLIKTMRSPKSRIPRWTYCLAAAVLLIIALEQWFSYQRLRAHVGHYAYAANYARRFIGGEGAYVGLVIDARWNAMPDRSEDIKGFQPRFLVAREVLPGVTESRWWCAYLVNLAPAPPAQFTPSPFPPLVLGDNAIN